jgi:predicted nicotinamide N-methyase
VERGLPVSPHFETPNQLDYGGPIEIATLTVGGVSIRLARPDEPDQLFNDPLVHEMNRRDDYMPYWAYLWPSAWLLGEYVACAPWSECPGESNATDVLEIGCGLGLVGMVALARGLRVQFSDYENSALQFVARSAAANGFDPARFSTRRLDWRELPDEQFAIILGADVIYEARLVPVVATLLGRLLAPAGVGLISSPYRAAAEAFPAALAEFGLVCQTEAATAMCEGGRVFEGLIYRVTR